jgi:hypothetical protein
MLSKTQVTLLEILLVVAVAILVIVLLIWFYSRALPCSKRDTLREHSLRRSEGCLNNVISIPPLQRFLDLLLYLVDGVERSSAAVSGKGVVHSRPSLFIRNH